MSDQNQVAVKERLSRRSFLRAGIVAGAGVAAGAGATALLRGPGASAHAPPPPAVFENKDTALVIIDPQNDVLSERGVSWGLVGASVRENHTVENIERLFRAAKERNYEVFISPHYLYPTDQAWQYGGAVEKLMLEGREFYRPDPLSLAGFTGSGADWLESFKPFIQDGKTIVVSPHKVYSPCANDLVLQLRKRRINKVILGGMMANLCVESHLRELIEQGFEVVVVKDATAAPRHPELGDGYTAALVNYGFLANAVMTTDEAVRAMF